jgi:hypothetical protein
MKTSKDACGRIWHSQRHYLSDESRLSGSLCLRVRDRDQKHPQAHLVLRRIAEQQLLDSKPVG